jgi:hypothetical protein
MIIDKRGPQRKRWGGELGAESELIACADLLHRGWHVYRSVSATAPCDLVIIKHGGVLRVEVKTGNAINQGKRSVRKEDEFEPRYDVLAIVFEGKVTYKPNLDALDGW